MAVQIDSKRTAAALDEHPDQGVICEVCQGTVAGDAARFVEVADRPPNPSTMLVCGDECARAVT